MKPNRSSIHFAAAFCATILLVACTASPPWNPSDDDDQVESTSTGGSSGTVAVSSSSQSAVVSSSRATSTSGNTTSSSVPRSSSHGVSSSVGGSTSIARSSSTGGSPSSANPISSSSSTEDYLTAGPIALPAGFMKSIKEYGAKGDGATDDTAAIAAALAENRPGGEDYYGKPKMLFFPSGTYVVSDTLKWNGCCVTLQGEGSGVSVIKLKDNAPGFDSAATPKPVVLTPSGNMSFRQNIFDLAIHVGPGNPGAIALDYISNNSGALRNIRLWSMDGQGVSGLAMTRQWPGPLLVKNVAIEGFGVGIHAKHSEYGPTLENILLSNQTTTGILNEGNTLAIRNLRSTNSAVAIRNTVAHGSILLLDSALQEGASSLAAIENSGRLYLRSVQASGYQAVVQGVNGTTVSEYVSGTVHSLFNATPPAQSLGLPVKETPVHVESNLSAWAEFKPRWYGDTGGLQDLLNSGASTVYFPAGGYFSYNERAVTVPPTVKRIIGFTSVVNRDAAGTNGGGIRFLIEDDSTDPLVIEQFAYGVKVEQSGKRPVAIKHGAFSFKANAGAGDLFLEDVVIGPVTMVAGQNLWARQFNNEYGGTKITNPGGNLWILGLKTEREGTVISTTNGGSTELLGTLIYPATEVPRDQAAFINVDSRISLIYSVSSYITNGNYAVQVRETRNGETRELATATTGGRISLYVGY